jgi:hypothetical protein
MQCSTVCYVVKDLVFQTVDQLQTCLPDRFQIVFDNGVVTNTTKRHLIYSHYFWKIHRYYRNVPITDKHYVTAVLKDKPLTSSTHIKLLTNIYKDTIKIYNLHLPEQKEHLLRLVYEVTNDVHNEVAKFAEEYVTTVDILDCINIVEHPDIHGVIEAIENNSDSISAAYKVILDVIRNDPSLHENALAKAMRTDMVNANQVLQCVGVRGFPTEVDGTILPYPILSNYTKGMKTLYDFLAESRTAAKSLYFTDSPLQDAEYFARRLQLLAMVVEKIDYVDCGTKKHLQWRVSPPVYDEKGNKTYNGDLEFMIGKYYLDEQTGKYFEITGDNPALHNKVLQIRTVIFCQHPDTHKVCEVCFGALSGNVSRHANLGHLCAATMTQQTSQSVLSTKHLDASSVSTNITLSEVSGRYFTTNKTKNAYIIKKELSKNDVKMIVNRDQATGLTDILSIDDVKNINPIRVSNLDCVEILLKCVNEEISMPIFVNQGNRKAVFTIEFLQYLKTHRWETDSRNNFIFDLKHWDFSIPVMKLPDMEYSYSDHSHQISKVIESSMANITDRLNPHSPVSTLQELFQLVNQKLNVNIAALEVIIYANMISSKDDYSMGRHSPEPVLGVSNMVIKNRSLSSAYAFQDQITAITSPRSFFKMGRSSSVFDVFISPREVVEEERSKQ